jgi:orotidine-5'-phosphate decarboxylase
VGAQGGDLAATCRYGLNRDIGLLINSSRGIIYADNSVHFAEKAAEEARKLQLEMASFLG